MDDVSLKDYANDAFYWKLTNKIELTRHGTYYAFKFLFQEGYLHPHPDHQYTDLAGIERRHFMALKEFQVVNDITDTSDNRHVVIEKGERIIHSGTMTRLIDEQKR